MQCLQTMEWLILDKTEKGYFVTVEFDEEE